MIEEHQIRALHVEALDHDDLPAEHGGPHVLFQTSTLAALLDGAYEGDLTLGELVAHGDLGLGTTNGLDGELIVLDGRCLRADADGDLTELDPGVKTPFAVVAPFQPTIEAQLEGPLDFTGLAERLDGLMEGDAPSCAVRIEGRFQRLIARSVPRQEPPYKPLADVVAAQVTFELGPVEGTAMGFRFPDYAQGLELGGWHLHFADSKLERGGHILDLELTDATVQIDPSSEVHAEMPPGVELGSVEADEGLKDLIDSVERSG